MILMSKLLSALAVAVSGLVLLAGCGSGAGGSGAGGSAGRTSDGRLRVVVAFYPLQFVAQRVAGDQADITSLTQPGAEPHDLELTPRQVASLVDADVVIYQKGFQAAVDEAVVQAAPKHLIDTTTLVPLREESADDGHGHDHGTHDHGTDDHGADEHGADSHQVMDPHLWLDPTNMSAIATAVAGEFAQVRPEQKAAFTTNAQHLDSELTALDQEFNQGLASCERREFITSHAAFGYLAARYHLVQIGISGLDPEAEPSPSRIAQIHTEADEYGITTIFYETLVSPSVAESIASDLGLQTAVLDPIEGITAQSAGDDYTSVMRANLAALEKANGCRP